VNQIDETVVPRQNIADEDVATMDTDETLRRTDSDDDDAQGNSLLRR